MSDNLTPRSWGQQQCLEVGCAPTLNEGGVICPRGQRLGTTLKGPCWPAHC